MIRDQIIEDMVKLKMEEVASGFSNESELLVNRVHKACPTANIMIYLLLYLLLKIYGPYLALILNVIISY